MLISAIILHVIMITRTIFCQVTEWVINHYPINKSCFHCSCYTAASSVETNVTCMRQPPVVWMTVKITDKKESVAWKLMLHRGVPVPQAVSQSSAACQWLLAPSFSLDLSISPHPKPPTLLFITSIFLWLSAQRIKLWTILRICSS